MPIPAGALPFHCHDCLVRQMAKADGVVTQDEIRAFQDIFPFRRKKPPMWRGFTILPGRMWPVSRLMRASLRACAPKAGAMPSSGRYSRWAFSYCARPMAMCTKKELAFLSSVADIFGYDEAGFDHIAIRHMVRARATPMPFWDRSRCVFLKKRVSVIVRW